MDYFKNNKCKICGETFLTLRKLIFHIKKSHNIDKKQYLIQYENVNPICPICNERERFYTNHNSRLFSNTCGNKECINEYNKRFLNLYTSDKIEKAKKKRDKTVLNKYGVKNVFQIDNIKEKSKKTKFEKYGNEYYTNREKFKEYYDNIRNNREVKYCIYCGKSVKYYNGKYRLTCSSEECISKFIKDRWKNYTDEEIKNINKNRINSILKKYGVDNISKLENTIFKIKKTKFERYGNENYTNREKCRKTRAVNSIKRTLKYRDDIEFLEVLDNGLYKIKCKKCNNIFEDIIYGQQLRPRCLKCNPIKHSTIENSIFIIMKKYILDVQRNNRKILDGLEIDLYSPEYRLGIECNGNYWHSSIFKDNMYHYRKWLLSIKKNINLLSFYEDEIQYKRKIIESMIKNRLGISENIYYARKTKIKEIDSNTAELFLIDNHINGYVKSSIRLGMFLNNELISVITLSKNRFKKDEGWEITRYASKINSNVVGGFSKFIKYIERNYDFIKEIVTFADCRFSTYDNVYEKNGFLLIEHTRPNYYYIKDYYRFHRSLFMKHKLKDKLKKYDDSLTESENMAMNGYIKIFDCGNLKYKKIIDR